MTGAVRAASMARERVREHVSDYFSFLRGAEKNKIIKEDVQFLQRMNASALESVSRRAR
jgi:hypothetical protein